MYMLTPSAFVEDPIDDEKILAMFYVLRGNGVKIPPGVSQVIDCIQDICLSDPIVTDKAIDLLVELKVSLIEILEIN
jgi:hypothetical protein